MFKLSAQITILALSVLLSFGLGWWAAAYNTEAQNREATETIIRLPNGRIIRTPKDHRVVVKTEDAVDGGYQRNYRAGGESTGGFGRGTGALKANTSPASFDLTDGEEKGFGSGVEAMAAGAQRGTYVITFAGIIFVAAGVLVLIFVKSIRIAMVCFLSGGALIATGLLVSIYPWILLVGFVAVLGVLGYFLYTTWQSGKLKKAFNKVVFGIENADADTQKKVKEKIKEIAKTDKDKKIVKDEVTKAKNKPE